MRARSSTPAPATRDRSTTRVGLIGCGNIARVHLRYLQQLPDVEIVGFCDQDGARAEALRDAAGAGCAVTSPDALLELDPHAVHILTPPHTHADVAIHALEHGLHVLVEKPMATTSADAERMEASAKAHARLLCVDHNRLFDPIIEDARALVAGGQIGTLVSVEALQGVNVQEGGAAPTPSSMWMNLAPHPLYLIRAFAGEIQEWQAMGGAHGELRAVLKGTRALGTLVFSPATNPYLNALILHGSRGTLQLDLNTMTLVRRRERRLPRMLAKAFLNVDHALQLLGGTTRTMAKVLTRRMGTYPGMGIVIRRFHDAVRDGGSLPVTARDGRAVVQLLEHVWAQAQDPRPEPSPRRKWSTGWLPGRNGNTVLVTGASGFLGTHVVAELQRHGHHVRAMLHAGEPPQEWSGVETVHAALGDTRAISRALTGVTTVVHCAARVARNGTRTEFFRDNVGGTAHLLEAAAAAGVRRFVHVSSIGIYGHTNGGEAIKENGDYDLHPELRGAYTWSKLESDRLVSQWSPAGDMRAIVVRPGIIVGSAGPRFLARLSFGPIAGRLLIVGRKRARLPLCHVDDVARGVAAAVTADDARGAYNLVEDSLTQAEWLRAVGVGRVSPRAIFVPPWVAALGAAMLELVWRLAGRGTPSISRYKIKRATESLRYDTTRARRDLGWRPDVGVRTLSINGRATQSPARIAQAAAPHRAAAPTSAAHRGTAQPS